jgi:hypothetical protein
MAKEPNSQRAKYAVHIPPLSPRILPGTFRHDVVSLLKTRAAIGIELGVAEGTFSERMVRSNRFGCFYGVDAYCDKHNTEEYKRALSRIGLEANYKLLRMSFDDAYDLFPNAYFDFIYIDGYAETGADGGDTIFKWYRKLKLGGVFAGDDYHEDWPLVRWAVNELVLQTGSNLLVTELIEKDLKGSHYPSWALIKTNADVQPTPPCLLREYGRQAKKHQSRRRQGALIYRLSSLLKNHIARLVA